MFIEPFLSFARRRHIFPDLKKVEGVQLAQVPIDETKEQRQAREKAERETLKLAVVVEGLDSQGRPLAEPNLQVTYIRLTSLPLRSANDDGAAAAGSEAPAAPMQSSKAGQAVGQGVP